MRSIMNELASHKTALKQLQDSFFDKVCSFIRILEIMEVGNLDY